MIDLTRFMSRLKIFGHLDYAGDFDGFWKWKLGIEARGGHILDDNHRRETYGRLCSILPRWLTYRGAPVGIKWKQVLEDSLTRISEAYNQVRNHSLLQFREVPDEPLRSIWHELGRVKEESGNTNPGGWYYIVAITKPLMFLWGQTLAFDSIVRPHAPQCHNVQQHTRWCFEEWKRIMESFQDDMGQQPDAVQLFKTTSKEKYGTDLIVPYGQFLDLYYWVEGKEQQQSTF